METIYLPEESEFRTADYDLLAALRYNPQEYAEEDIKHIHATVAGANDEADWYWVVEFRKPQNGYGFALIKGGCDYTGWDCQSWAETEYADSPEDAARKSPETETYRGRQIQSCLLKQLSGEELYGVYTYPAGE